MRSGTFSVNTFAADFNSPFGGYKESGIGREHGPTAIEEYLLYKTISVDPSQELPEEIVLSVRDDGPGIPPGRLEEAAAEGRMGVVKSIRGRVQELGGTIDLETAPGEGTEWEIRVPRPVKQRKGGKHD